MSKDCHRRNTRQRQVVLEELRSVLSHPTASDVYELARRRLPRISLGTIYRNLEILTQEGVIRRLDSVGGEARFDGDISEHHHVRCVRCGAVGDVHGLVDPMAIADIRHLGGYEILGYRLRFEGICPSCQAARSGPGAGAATNINPDTEAGGHSPRLERP